ncbi:MAG TPA: restriction endonuclease [Anaerolineales bacterium]
MPVPDFQTIMLPMLKIAGDGKEHTVHDFLEILAKEFNLSQEELNEFLPSGKQTRFFNRVGWAKTYLSKSGLLVMARRPYYVITERGKDALKKNPVVIDLKFLQQFPEYVQFRTTRRKSDNEEVTESISAEQTPEEILDEAFEDIRGNLASDLLESVKSCSPKFFEQLVVELLVNMGYGGSRRDAARAVGQSGDGGIDGIIDEDRLGLDTIYIQAKRWEGTVGRPDIQKFAGALMGKKANKGIFITTSNFTKDAVEYVSSINSKIILVDGNRLTELMIDYNIGVTNITSYNLKRIDSDYFGNGG